MPIESLGPAGFYTPPTSTEADSTPTIGPAPSDGPGFAQTLGEFIGEANSDLVQATQKAVDLVVHGRGTIHDTMIAIDNAEGSFRLLMEMRNRIVEGVNRLLETQL